MFTIIATIAATLYGLIALLLLIKNIGSMVEALQDGDFIYIPVLFTTTAFWIPITILDSYKKDDLSPQMFIFLASWGAVVLYYLSPNALTVLDGLAHLVFTGDFVGHYFMGSGVYEDSGIISLILNIRNAILP